MKTKKYVSFFTKIFFECKFTGFFVSPTGVTKPLEHKQRKKGKTTATCQLTLELMDSVVLVGKLRCICYLFVNGLYEKIFFHMSTQLSVVLDHQFSFPHLRVIL
jgi:hypothetical protein